MKKIKLYNRDGADLWLENTGEQLDENIAKWKLNVDDKHKYCLEYMRIIDNYQAIDPSGGPMLSVGDTFEGKYKIINIINPTTFWISEKHNNN